MEAEPALASQLASATWVSGTGAAMHLIANYDTGPATVWLGAPVGASRTVETPWQPASNEITIPGRSLGLVR